MASCKHKVVKTRCGHKSNEDHMYCVCCGNCREDLDSRDRCLACGGRNEG